MKTLTLYKDGDVNKERVYCHAGDQEKVFRDLGYSEPKPQPAKSPPPATPPAAAEGTSKPKRRRKVKADGDSTQ